MAKRRNSGPRLVRIRGVLVNLESGATTLAKGNKPKKPKAKELEEDLPISEDGTP